MCISYPYYRHYNANIMLSHGFCLRRGGFLTKSAVCGRADVLHLVMVSEVETSFSSRARWTRHAVSLRWVLNRTPSATLLRREFEVTASTHFPVRGLWAGEPRPYGDAGIPNREYFFRGEDCPSLGRGTSNNVAEGVRDYRVNTFSSPRFVGGQTPPLRVLSWAAFRFNF